jgi:hypothetical protein
MLVLTDYLKAIDAWNEQRVNDLKALIDFVAQSQSMQSTQLQLLTSGSLTFRLEAPQPLSLALPSILPASRYASAQASIVATPLACSPGLLLQQQQQNQDQDQDQDQDLLEPPKYRMCRAVRLVEAL